MDHDSQHVPATHDVVRRVTLVATPAGHAQASRLSEGLALQLGCTTELRDPCWLTAAASANTANADLLMLFLDDWAPDSSLLNLICQRHPVLLVVQPLHRPLLPTLLAQGAVDFVMLPCRDDELALRAQQACMSSKGTPRPTARGRLTPSPGTRHLIGNSPAFLRQVEKLDVISAVDASVLILGETGTGKEVFAQAVHYHSARSGKPFIAVNCGAIPNDLIEDELFGHVRGAYTTAHAARAGLLREAEGGSLFLDDIDCLPLAAQCKLLRFLQEREYRVVGSNTVLRADVRVIAASNRDLGSLAQQGGFRQDLFYRLNVLGLSLPPLRERLDDIHPLALHFTRLFARRFERGLLSLSPAAISKLQLHDWPGNVRELQHQMERAVLFAKGPLLLPEDIDVGEGAAPCMESFQEAKARVIQKFERSYLQMALSSSQGNVAEAARTAGKHRRAFFELIRKHHIAPEGFRASAC
jgi:two-component system, NtrC family, response regulator GlrR